MKLSLVISLAVRFSTVVADVVQYSIVKILYLKHHSEFVLFVAKSCKVELYDSSEF